MKLKVFNLLALLAMLLAACGPVQPGCASQAPASRPCNDSDVRHCTILTVSQGNRAFFGGNDDYINRDSTYWVDPGSEARYGAIYFGEPDNVQQGFNEKGLAYDANGLPKAPVTSHPGRKPVYGGYTSYPIQILRECATVEEVIAWVQEHRWHKVMHDQLHLADATGDAVVISAGPDGKVAFTRKPAGDSFLVSTNFNVANPSNGGYPCWRYSRAEKMLRQIQAQDELTAERVASIMDAVHVEGPSGWTIYSVVADLPQRLVYVYFWFQYDAPIVLNVDEEIARAPASGPLSALFPPETVSRADQAYRRLMSRSARCDVAARAWLGVVGACLVALLFFSWRGRRTAPRGLVFWMPAVALLGPVGLLVWLIAWRGQRRDAEAAPPIWWRTLVETTGDLPPYVVGLVVALLAAFLVPELSGGSLIQLLVICGLPLVCGLLLFHGPLLAYATRSGYGRIVVRRLPAALVSTNLSLAGMLAVAAPLMVWCANYCGFSALAIPRLWVMAVLGALVGGLPLYAYHAWAVRRGFTAWSALLWGSEAGDSKSAISTPSWRRLWLWILVSFVALVAGMALGAIGIVLAASVM
jgi:choloylglycine hydrolase